ncbi:hypothetical protein HOY80DRAFT_973452 [Tuber brumale]|nr:hypothetical protein HOY80DRAFT_973452 [Tuber brumale]
MMYCIMFPPVPYNTINEAFFTITTTFSSFLPFPRPCPYTPALSGVLFFFVFFFNLHF